MRRHQVNDGPPGGRPGAGRSSDSKAGVKHAVLLGDASQPREEPVLLPLFVPFYRCGTVPESHRVPCYPTPWTPYVVVLEANQHYRYYSHACSFVQLMVKDRPHRQICPGPKSACETLARTQQSGAHPACLAGSTPLPREV